jgi:hypothetical protein
MEAKKRQQRKAQDASLINNSHWAHDAPDNPPNSIRRWVIVDPRGILEKPENWDERLWPRTSNTLDDTYNVHE